MEEKIEIISGEFLPEVPIVKWEYAQIQKFMHEYEINNLGSEGWELVSFQMSVSQWRDGAYVYLFKRPIKE